MSNVSIAHNVFEYISGKSEALTGQRLAKVTYRKKGDNPKGYKNICTSVPMVTNDEIMGNISSLMPYIRNLVETTQDAIIRSLNDSADGNLTTVTDNDISIAQVINYLGAESVGSRLTKEYLVTWFNDNIQDALVYTFGVKLGFISANDDNPTMSDNQLATLAKHINGYRDMVSSLAGGKTILQDNQIKSIRKAIEIAGVNDDTSVKLTNRLDAMATKPKIEELLDL